MALVEFHRVSKTYPDGTLAVRDLTFDIKNGEFVVLVGPSGCGKSTVLRMLGGLEEISSGEIKISGTIINHLAPQQRNIAMVFQNYALYPHMSVRKNMEFPLKMMHLKKEEQQHRIKKTAELLGLTPLLGRKPKNLSGGQRQRAAMARALVRDPVVLLLDEPLSNLDAKLRVQIRGEIAALQRQTKRTTLYVTHDQIEAMTLGDRVAVLRDGILQQIAPPQELYEQPANIFVAGFIGSPGMNIFPTVLRAVKDGEIEMMLGDRQVPIPSEVIARHTDLANHMDTPLLAGLRPEAFFRIGDGAENRAIRIQVAGVEPLGHETIIYFTLPETSTEQQAHLRSIPAAKTVSHQEDIGKPEKTHLMALRWNSSRRLTPKSALSVGIDTSKVHFFSLNGTAIK